MKRLLIAALLSAPLLAHADAYRCKQADGSTSFQDHPCAGTARGGTYQMPSAQGYAPPPAPMSSAPPGTAPGGAASGDQVRALTDQANAAARESRCRSARRNLAMLNEQVRVYSRDDKGNRVYVDDKDRPAATAAAQEQIDSDCE